MKNEDIIKVENLRYSSDTYVIRWNMTKLCNYHCDFCVQGTRQKHLLDSKGESNGIRMTICNKLVDFIENKLNHNYTYLHIYLIGGEITILKDFTELLSKLLSVKFDGDIEFHITTNLSADVKVLKEIKNLFKRKECSYSRRLSISASYYKEYTTENEFINKVKALDLEKNLKYYLVRKKHLFMNKKDKFSCIIYKCLKQLEKSTPNIVISISYPLVVDADYASYLKFKKRYHRMVSSINYIIIRNYKKSISDELKEKLSKNNKKRIKVTTKDNSEYYFSGTNKISLAIEPTKHFNPQGFMCDSGVHSLSIGSTGIISRCPSCAKQTVVGNILEDDINLLNECLICPNTSCSCDYYHVILKNDKK